MALTTLLESKMNKYKNRSYEYKILFVDSDLESSLTFNIYVIWIMVKSALIDLIRFIGCSIWLDRFSNVCTSGCRILYSFMSSLRVDVVSKNSCCGW